MKTFTTSGTGSGQTLSEIESDKIPIYATESDAETDLPNLKVGQIIAIITIGAERLAYVVNENGTKKIKDLTANVGTGAPVGSYLYLEKKSNPQGYLYCDGSTFDSTAYPALYQYLGTNVLPDFREFSPVGAEQNTTNVYDASTNPNGVIHDHDVYTEGQAKDDQLQEHRHIVQGSNTDGTGDVQNVRLGNNYDQSPQTRAYYAVSMGRYGAVTRGKRKAVFIYIKATSGLTENQQENVLNTINENLSYSTEEHATGKKWIDGKPIYSKVIEINSATASTSTQSFPHGVTGLEKIITHYGNCMISNRERIYPYVDNDNKCYLVYYDSTNIVLFFGYSTTNLKLVIEYTKTT